MPIDIRHMATLGDAERQRAVNADGRQQQRDVLALVVGQGVRLTVLGIAVGMTAAVVLTRALRSQLYGVQPTDPATFGPVVALLLVVPLVAAWLPARRARKVDPMVALRGVIFQGRGHGEQGENEKIPNPAFVISASSVFQENPILGNCLRSGTR